jgi:Flp pilus assembly protein TadD
MNLYLTLSMVPENSELYSAIGAIYLKLGNSDEAFEYFGNAILYDSSFNNVNMVI